MTATSPRSEGLGWVCEAYRHLPVGHAAKGNGEACDGTGAPCEEPGCQFRTHPTDAEVTAMDPA